MKKIFINSNLTENDIESLMGGFSKSCLIWGALGQKGISFICNAESALTTLYTMTSEKLHFTSIETTEFFELAHSLGEDDFANEMLNRLSIHEVALGAIDQLIEESQSHRVLWAATTWFLEGPKDRRFDSCYEMHDGAVVANAVKASLKSIACNDLSKLTLEMINLRLVVDVLAA